MNEIRLTARLFKSLYQPKFGCPAILSRKLIWDRSGHTFLLVKLDLGPQSLEEVPREPLSAGTIAGCIVARSKVLGTARLSQLSTSGSLERGLCPVIIAWSSINASHKQGRHRQRHMVGNLGEEDFISIVSSHHCGRSPAIQRLPGCWLDSFMQVTLLVRAGNCRTSEHPSTERMIFSAIFVHHVVREFFRVAGQC